MATRNSGQTRASRRPGAVHDTWMHRMDTARAVDVKAVLTPEHDGRIVADIVADWARRHGKPFELMLAWPAGGSYRSGTSGERLHLEAVEFCRLLSGRDGGGEGLLATFTPFWSAQLAEPSRRFDLVSAPRGRCGRYPSTCGSSTVRAPRGTRPLTSQTPLCASDAEPSVEVRSARSCRNPDTRAP